MEPITQRCVKFFAWGLKQRIRSTEDESTEAIESTDVTESTVENEDYDEIFDDVQQYGMAEEDGSSDSDDEIINVRPLNAKPTMRFSESSLGSRLGSFLTEMKGANEKLLADVESGDNPSFELSDSEEGHIEMNLGLGVLEEKAEDAEQDTTTEAERSVIIEEL
jgi:hypothetical protein